VIALVNTSRYTSQQNGTTYWHFKLLAFINSIELLPESFEMFRSCFFREISVMWCENHTHLTQEKLAGISYTHVLHTNISTIQPPSIELIAVYPGQYIAVLALNVSLFKACILIPQAFFLVPEGKTKSEFQSNSDNNLLNINHHDPKTHAIPDIKKINK